MIRALKFNLYFGFKKFEKQEVARAGKVFALAKEIIFVLPFDPEEARASSVIAEHFKKQGKKVLAVSVNNSAELIPSGLYHEIIVLQMKKLTPNTLPPKPVKQLLQSKSADIVFDLSRSDNYFFRFAARTIPASFYAGVDKNDAERFFDFIFRPDSDKAEEIYSRFLESITMFERN